MNKTEKAEIISEIKDLIGKSSSIYLMDYHGIKVEDISNLRREFGKEGVNYKVFKNTFFKKAIDEVGGYEKFNDLLVGMTGAAFIEENFVAPAKIIKKYAKTSDKFKFKGCYIEKDFYGKDQLDELASMPTKAEMMSSIIGSIAAPASGIVGAINAVIRDLVSVVDQISKKEAA
ncbi:MAG: 50S ribosomal protein L10 [bacterium]